MAWRRLPGSARCWGVFAVAVLAALARFTPVCEGRDAPWGPRWKLPPRESIRSPHVAPTKPRQEEIARLLEDYLRRSVSVDDVNRYLIQQYELRDGSEWRAICDAIGKERAAYESEVNRVLSRQKETHRPQFEQELLRLEWKHVQDEDVLARRAWLVGNLTPKPYEWPAMSPTTSKPVEVGPTPPTSDVRTRPLVATVEDPDWTTQAAYAFASAALVALVVVARRQRRWELLSYLGNVDPPTDAGPA
jgi:hypothetical protein